MRERGTEGERSVVGSSSTYCSEEACSPNTHVYMYMYSLSTLVRTLVEGNSHSDGFRGGVALSLHLHWHAHHGGWFVACGKETGRG